MVRFKDILRALLVGILFVNQSPMLANTHYLKFEQKVSTFVANARRNAQSKQLHIHPTLRPSIKKIIVQMNDIHPSMDIQELDKRLGYIDRLFNQLEVIYETARAENGWKKEFEHEQQELYCAVLLKASTVMGSFAHTLIVQVLDMLARQIAYWEKQRNHPIQYFFHKSPTKWFHEKNQSKEIQENLRYLRCIQREHFKILGKLVAHKSTYTIDCSLEEQCKWLHSFFVILHNFCSGVFPTKNESSISTHMLFAIAQETLKKLPLHKSKVNQVISHAKKPAHVVRNWLWYTGLAASCAAGALYVKNNPGLITQLVARSRLAVGNYYERWVKKPFNDVIEILWPNYHAKAESGATPSNHPPMPPNRNFDKMFPDFEEIKVEDPKAYPFICALKDLLVSECEKKFMRRDQAARIWNEVRSDFGINNLQHYLNDLIKDQADKTFSFSRFSTWGNANVIDPAKRMVNVVHVISFGLIAGAHKQVDSLFQQNRLTLAALACIPSAIALGAGLKGLKWTYEKMTPVQEYRHIKKSVDHIANLLLEVMHVKHTRKMDDVERGQLLYFTNKLKKEGRKLPEHVRLEFLRQVNSLERAELVEDKKAYIDQMYKQYSFLVPTK